MVKIICHPENQILGNLISEFYHDIPRDRDRLASALSIILQVLMLGEKESFKEDYRFRENIDVIRQFSLMLVSPHHNYSSVLYTYYNWVDVIYNHDDRTLSFNLGINSNQTKYFDSVPSYWLKLFGPDQEVTLPNFIT